MAKTIAVDVKLFEQLVHALEAAPDRRRIEFQPYWDWWQHTREAALDAARELRRGA